QSELDLPRIIGSIARRTDLAKAGTSEITRARNRDHAVTAKIRCVEVRVVEDVKELRAELQPESFRERNVLEQREVHALEGRAGNLVRAAPQGGERAGYRSTRGRLGKCLRIAEQAQLPVGVDVQPPTRVSHEEVITAGVRSSA